MNKIVIFGSAEIAELAKFYFEEERKAKVVAFTVDDDFISTDSFLGVPLIPFSKIEDLFPPSEFQMHIALSYSRLNKLREEKYNQVKDKGYILKSFVSDRSVISSSSTIGDNCFILENQTIQPNVVVGDNVMMWSGNHIGHGSVIGNHTYFASHVVLSGNCKIGERCFFGVNSTVVDFCVIEDDCFITMDSSVIKNLEKGSVTLASRSTVLSQEDKLAKKIKKNYFKM